MSTLKLGDLITCPNPKCQADIGILTINPKPGHIFTKRDIAFKPGFAAVCENDELICAKCRNHFAVRQNISTMHGWRTS